MHIYIVNGAPGSGKTTFEQLIRSEVGSDWVFILSTITPIKEAAKNLGWNGQKTPIDRLFLSNLKDLCSEFYDTSFKYIENEISKIHKSFEVYDMSSDNAVVFIDSREPDEIERFRDEFGAKTILIKRVSGADDGEILNHADRDVDDVAYNYVIENCEGLECLREECKLWLDVEGIKRPSR